MSTLWCAVWACLQDAYTVLNEQRRARTCDLMFHLFVSLYVQRLHKAVKEREKAAAEEEAKKLATHKPSKGAKGKGKAG